MAVDARGAFTGIEGRQTVDYALLSIQQNQSQLSSMADTKASILITVCSIVLTAGLSGFATPSLRWPFLLLAASVLLSLIFAVLAVLPSVSVPRRSDGTVDLAAPSFNVTFFGHFAALSRERFEELFADVARDDAQLYAMLARDIYGQGIVLDRKYRMLRRSYLTFIVGILAAAVHAVGVLLLV
ncbi:hypothetical protein K2Z84_01480 [Candidatus Binatia bacterium]|nr:hypothetical protein [Candidatus Binatia bacterium]